MTATDSATRPFTKLCLWLIAFIGVIVPRRLRADWRQEWEAELRYRETLLAEWNNLNWRTKFDLLWHSLGAFMDALWLQPRRMEDEMFQDLRYGMRILLKSKGFTAVSALTLALGIGANTALFSVMDAVMLKTLPVRDPEQLVVLSCLGVTGWYKGFIGSNPKDPATGLRTTTSMSFPAFERFRDQNQTMSSVFAFASLGVLNLNVDGQAETASGQVVSGNYFAGLGVSVFLGRAFTTEDDKTTAAPAAVISHRYWRRRFGADPAVVGKVIYINGAAFTIIGVTPPRFFGTLDVGSAPDITIPMGTLAQASQFYAGFQRSATAWWLQIMGRLKPGASAEQAQSDLNAILQRGANDIYFKPERVPRKLPDAATQRWPTGDANATAPMPEGVNAAAIQAALDWGMAQKEHNTRAIVLVYRGKIVGERYAPGWTKDTPQISWSEGKSITAALIGLLARQGRLRVDDFAPVKE